MEIKIAFLLIAVYLLSGVIDSLFIISNQNAMNKLIEKVDGGLIYPNVYKVIICLAPVLNTAIAGVIVSDLVRYFVVRFFVYIKWMVRKWRRAIK